MSFFLGPILISFLEVSDFRQQASKFFLKSSEALLTPNVYREFVSQTLGLDHPMDSSPVFRLPSQYQSSLATA